MKTFFVARLDAENGTYGYYYFYTHKLGCFEISNRMPSKPYKLNPPVSEVFVWAIYKHCKECPIILLLRF